MGSSVGWAGPGAQAAARSETAKSNAITFLQAINFFNTSEPPHYYWLSLAIDDRSQEIVPQAANREKASLQGERWGKSGQALEAGRGQAGVRERTHSWNSGYLLRIISTK